MNDLTIPEPAHLEARPTDQLLTDLRDAIGMTAAAIRRVAVIWAELERRGVDLSQIRFSLASYMRAVARGTLLPEAVAALAGQRRKLDMIAQLPTERQRALIIDAEPIEIINRDGDVMRATVTEMTLAQAALAIRDGDVRAPDEQRVAMRRASATKRPTVRGRPVRILVDADGGTMQIGHVTVPLDRVMAALRAAKVGL